MFLTFALETFLFLAFALETLLFLALALETFLFALFPLLIFLRSPPPICFFLLLSTQTLLFLFLLHLSIPFFHGFLLAPGLSICISLSPLLFLSLFLNSFRFKLFDSLFLSFKFQTVLVVQSVLTLSAVMLMSVCKFTSLLGSCLS